MAVDNSKKIIELLEAVRSKVNDTGDNVNTLSNEIIGVKEQLSNEIIGVKEHLLVVNKKLNNLQSGMNELNKKADEIFEFASGVDEDLQKTKNRVTRLEKPQAVA